MTSHRPARRPALAALLTAAATALVPAAHAIVEVAEGELFIGAEAAVVFDSNIVGNSSELSDTIFEITPGVYWERSRGRGSIQLGLTSTIERYADYSNQDSENFAGTFALDMPATPSGRLRGSLNAGFFDGDQIDPYLANRLSMRTYNVALRGSYQVSHRISARFGTTYDHSKPENTLGYTNRAYTIGAGYNVRPELSTFVDLRFTDSDTATGSLVGGRTKNTGEAILVGVDGQVTQKISGRLGVGYQQSDVRTGGISSDDSGLTLDVALTWKPRTRTTLMLDATRDVRVTSIAEAAEYTTYGLTLTQDIATRISVRARVGMTSSDFDTASGRSDDVLTALIGATYSIADRHAVGISYTLTDSDSNNLATDFSRSVFRVYGSVRF